MPNLCKGTCLSSRRRAESTIACLGSSAGPKLSFYSHGTEINRLLTGPTVRNYENADGLVVEGRLLNPRDIEIQNLLQLGTKRRLTCHDVNKE